MSQHCHGNSMSTLTKLFLPLHHSNSAFEWHEDRFRSHSASEDHCVVSRRSVTKNLHIWNRRWYFDSARWTARESSCMWLHPHVLSAKRQDCQHECVFYQSWTLRWLESSRLQDVKYITLLACYRPLQLCKVSSHLYTANVEEQITASKFKRFYLTNLIYDLRIQSIKFSYAQYVRCLQQQTLFLSSKGYMVYFRKHVNSTCSCEEKN